MQSLPSAKKSLWLKVLCTASTELLFLIKATVIKATIKKIVAPDPNKTNWTATTQHQSIMWEPSTEDFLRNNFIMFWCINTTSSSITKAENMSSSSKPPTKEQLLNTVVFKMRIHLCWSHLSAYYHLLWRNRGKQVMWLEIWCNHIR